jgi:hypothetical protein
MMLPKPATMATPPSTASPPSSNPAVPPPPVIGAPVGYGLGEGLGDGLACGVALEPAAADGLAEGLALALALALAEALAEALALALALAEPLADGDRIVTVPLGLPVDVQAESAMQASTVARPPAAVSLTRCAVHAMAVRAFIEPPDLSAITISRSPAAETGAGQKLRAHNRKPRP